MSLVFLPPAGLVPEPASQVAEGRAPQGGAEEAGRTGTGRSHRETGLQGRGGGARRRGE